MGDASRAIVAVLVSGAGPAEPNSMGVLGARPGGGRRRVVVAEDDASMRELLVEALARDGYDVVEAKDGAQLLLGLEEICLRGPEAVIPDLIVSDIRMPGHTGLELLQAMRDADIHLPVVLITAFSDGATRERAERAGAVLLDKPLDLDDLRKVVRGMMP